MLIKSGYREVRNMGYIAPITQFQYMQYSERVEAKPKIQDPFPVTNVQKVDNRSKFLRTLDERLEMANSEREKRNQSDYQKAEVPSYLFSKMTGKGRHFNEYA